MREDSASRLLFSEEDTLYKSSLPNCEYPGNCLGTSPVLSCCFYLGWRKEWGESLDAFSLLLGEG